MTTSVDAVVVPDILRLAGEYELNYDPDTGDDFPFSLWRGDEKLVAYRNGQAVTSDLDCYPDDIVPPEQWQEIWDWCRADRDNAHLTGPNGPGGSHD